MKKLSRNVLREMVGSINQPSYRRNNSGSGSFGSGGGGSYSSTRGGGDAKSGDTELNEIKATIKVMQTKIDELEKEIKELKEGQSNQR